MKFEENDMKLMGIVTRSMRMGHPVYWCVFEIIRASRALSKLAVKECNEGLTERDELKRAKLRASVSCEADKFDAVAHFDGDPRGYVVKLELPGGEHNELGGLWGVA